MMIYCALVLLASIPAGIFLAWLCSDEMKSDRKWFFLLFHSSVILFLLTFFFNVAIEISLALCFMILVAAVFILSYKFSFVKKEK